MRNICFLLIQHSLRKKNTTINFFLQNHFLINYLLIIYADNFYCWFLFLVNTFLFFRYRNRIFCLFFLIKSKSTNIENRVQIWPVLDSFQPIIFFRVSDKKILFFSEISMQVLKTLRWYFREYYHLTNLIKQSACVKNLEKPSCIDLILTHLFQMHPFSTSRKVMFSRGRKRVHWEQMG